MALTKINVNNTTVTKVDEVPKETSKNLITSDAVTKLDIIKNDYSSADLNISDDEGNVLAQFKHGHIQTNQFDSKYSVNVNLDDSSADLNISDEEGNVIAQFKDGHIKTLYFDSSKEHSDVVNIDGNCTNLAPIETLGCTDYQRFIDGYNVIASYGQSLSVGVSSTPRTTGTIEGAYMLGGSVRDTNSQTLNLLKAVSCEDFVVAMTQSMRFLSSRDGNVSQEFIATSSGVGGGSIDQCTNQFYHYFESHLTNAKAAAVAASKQVVCPIIVFCQGESDYETGMAKDTYKQKLVYLKEKMQASCQSILGQTSKPLFLVTMPGGRWASRAGRHFGRKETLYIHQAEYEACKENDDMILLGSSYFTPEFSGRHLASNGYRWLGEYCTKIYYLSINRKQSCDAVYPVNAFIGNGNVVLDTDAHTPLVIDDTLVTKKYAYGFSLRCGDTDIVELKKVITVGNRIIIQTGKLLRRTRYEDLFDTLNHNYINESGQIEGTDTKFATIGSVKMIGTGNYFSVALTSGYFARVFYYSSDDMTTCVAKTSYFEDGEVLCAQGDYMIITMKKGYRGIDDVPLSGSGVSYDGTEIVVSYYNAVDFDPSLTNYVLTYCQDTGGEGNIRDSELWNSRLIYEDDSDEVSTLPQDEKHISYSPNIVGQKYPCYNWLCPFTINVN